MEPFQIEDRIRHKQILSLEWYMSREESERILRELIFLRDDPSRRALHMEFDLDGSKKVVDFELTDGDA